LIFFGKIEKTVSQQFPILTLNLYPFGKINLIKRIYMRAYLSANLKVEERGEEKEVGQSS